MSRKLASVQIIRNIRPIPDADSIEIAEILGWNVVVKKDEFKIGDKIIYCEIDSLMPDKSEFEFLKPRGMRIRTIKLRGQISQGICFPLSILPNNLTPEVGFDCTEILEIIKYEPPIPACLSGLAKGVFPHFIPKTDETRVQVLQDLLDVYQGEKCYVTEKLDGSSVTFYLNNGEFGVCSRNLDLKEDDNNSFWKAAKEMNIQEKLQSISKNIAIQGELIGHGIQGNKLKIKGQIVKFFNVFDIDAQRYLDFENFIFFLENLNLPSVPILSSEYILTNDINEIVNYSIIKSTLNKDVWAEGIVIRPLNNKKIHSNSDAITNGRVSFKAINPEFLVEYGE